MERKIGEIFEDDGVWYQCVKGRCMDCYFSEKRYICKQFITKNFCTSGIIFKKLEKVGEPFTCNYYGDKKLITMQEYQLYDIDVIEGGDTPMYISDYKHQRIAIEIKQKEDMEEKKVILGELLYKYINGKITYDAFEKEVIELCGNKGESKLTLKDFDLEAAKAGKPVGTRDGRKARIICFDAKFPKTGNIVTLVEKENGEEVTLYHYDDGHCSIGRAYDLMMLPEKKEGWVNIDKGGSGKIRISSPYPTKEEAIHHDNETTIDTVKIEWEE